MSQRKTIRFLSVLVILFASAAATLGGIAVGCYEQLGVWKQRSANMKSALASAQASLEAAESRYLEKSAEAETLRAAAELSAQLQSEVALTQTELQGVMDESARQTSLAAAHEERSAALSAANEELQATVERLQAQAALDRAEIERLGAALTESEEELAGTTALYKEATDALHHARSVRSETQTELEQLQQHLTQVEEDYAGASALLAESDSEIARAKELAQSYYRSAEAAKLAAEAKQAEINLLRDQLAAAPEPEPMPSASKNTESKATAAPSPSVPHPAATSAP